MKPSTRNQLTPAEVQRRAELEEIIRPGIGNCITVGAALREMSDSRLYRSTHSTFKEYIEETYKIGVRTAYELVEHSETLEQVKNECAKFAQTATPSQTRNLRKSPPEKRVQIVKDAEEKAKSENRKVTAKDLAPAAEQRNEVAEAKKAFAGLRIVPEDPLGPFKVHLTDARASIPEASLGAAVEIADKWFKALWEERKKQADYQSSRKHINAYLS